MSADRVLQAAVLAALEADAPYVAKVTGGIFDADPPEDTDFPYTLIGDQTEVGRHTHEGQGGEHTVTIHDWSQLDGAIECQQIRELANDVLHGTVLSVTGWGLTKLIYEFGTVLVEYDEQLKKELRHQVTRYRCHSLES